MKNRLKLALALGLVFLALAACSEQPAVDSSSPELIEVKGQVVAPLTQASLYIYRQGMDLYGPAFAVSEETDIDGNFALMLPEGEYVAVVRKRVNGTSVGPVVAGDNRSEFLQLRVEQGLAQMTISAPLKVGDDRRLSVEEGESPTGFSGRITDVDGNPLKGVRVQVYDHVQMSERPKFVSEKTGPDGRYQILLPEGGTYYICARDNFGGPPKLGDLYGRYDQGTIEPSAVVIRKDEILSAVDIRVTKIW